MSGVRVEGKCHRDWEARRDGRGLLECEDSRVIFAKLWVNRPAADWIAVKCGIYWESSLLKVCFCTLDFQATKATGWGIDSDLDVTKCKVAIPGASGSPEDKAIIGEGFDTNAAKLCQLGGDSKCQRLGCWIGPRNALGAIREEACRRAACRNELLRCGLYPDRFRSGCARGLPRCKAGIEVFVFPVSYGIREWFVCGAPGIEALLITCLVDGQLLVRADGLGECREHFVVVALRDGVEFMVVAACAAHGQS